MSGVGARLGQGGITAVSDGDVAVPVVAVSYSHPALAGRSVVRLVPEGLVEAEDLTLGVSGFASQGGVRVGFVRRRAVGFPAWPIVHDPENAQHALNLVADLERAASLAQTKAGAAKSLLTELAARLDASAPHFLPTFLEEAGRIFLAVDNPQFASQMFSKAREAERRHNLPIDEVRHREVFLEFAYAGAVSGKELSAEAKSLGARLDPAEAYEQFRALCVERVRGGVAPYAGMKKDLATLAKAAGLKPAVEEVGVAADLLWAGSIQRAPGSFWKNYDKAIRKVAQADELLQVRLLGVFPEELGTDEWLGVLRDTGALERVKDGTHPDFVPRLIAWTTREGVCESELLAPVLTGILPGATSSPVTVRNYEAIPAAAFEQFLANDVTFTLEYPHAEVGLRLTEWADKPNRMPLPHLVAEESMREPLVEGLNDALRHEDLVETLVTDPHIRTLIVELLTGNAELLELTPPSVDRLVEVTDFVRSFEDVDDPEVQALLDRVRVFHRDPAEVLAETLRRGVPEELGWPELDVTVSALETQDADMVRQLDCWPGVMVLNDNHVKHIRGGVVTDIPNWTGETLEGATEVDGQYALVYRDTVWNDYITWSGDHKNLPTRHYNFSLRGLHATAPVPGGRLCNDETLMRPGHNSWSSAGSVLFVDGDRVWLANGDTGVELDPATGEAGRESLPDWFEEQKRRHPDLIFDANRSQHRPVTDETKDSPFSTADGYHRHAVFTRLDRDDYCLIVDADGTEYTVPGPYAPCACGVLRRPGGGTWVLAKPRRNDTVLDPSDLMPISCRGYGMSTGMWWHHTRPVDPQASERFRSITADDVRPLFDHLEDLPAAIGQHLNVTDEQLIRAIAEHTTTLAEAWPQESTSAKKGEQSSVTELAETPTLKKHKDLLASVLQYHRGDFDGMRVWQDTARLGLHNHEVPATTTYGVRFNWLELLGRADALLALAAVPGRTIEEVQTLKDLWVVLRDSGALSATHLTLDRMVTDTEDFYLADTDDPPATIRRYPMEAEALVLVRADGGGPVTIDGCTFNVLSSTPIMPSRTDLEPVFDALIERIEADGPLPWSVELGKEFADVSGAPVADAHLIVAGFPSFASFDVNFLPKKLRADIGLKVAQATEVRRRLKKSDEHFLGVLAAGVPEDATRLVTDGLDVQAMAAYWAEHGPDYEEQLPDHIAERRPKTIAEDELHHVITGTHENDWWADKVVAALWLAGELDLSDPLRANVASYLEQLDTELTGIRKVWIGTQYAEDEHNRLREMLGVPSRDPEDRSEQSFEVGRFTLEQETRWDRLYIDLSTITDLNDPDLALSRDMCIAAGQNMDTVAAATLRLGGVFGLYAQWLRQPGAGDPHDPLVAAPGVVAEVVAELSVSEDAARYYLQLLALPDPTDANVRRWNGWKKADITRAGAELVAAGVVVEGKRARSGRGFFLPGGWAEANSPHPPMELWKVNAFQMVTPVTRTKYEPMLRVPMAPVPPPEWFADRWERSRGDDGPQFAELSTTRRRP